jgi:hypothetical protein
MTRVNILLMLALLVSSLYLVRTAREKLAMRSATPAVTVYVHDDGGAAPGVRP